ncbi:MAG: serine--tRNA ligase [Endomicrobium sp.]|jgi:seryl-tRNA synthetase|nr:serine--tRNA ligase [Endomicrobium sp.]
MIDIKFIKENINTVKKAMLNRKETVNFDQLLKWDEERKFIIQEIEKLRVKRNKKSEEVYKIKKKYNKTPLNLLLENSKLRDIIKKHKKKLLMIEEKIKKFIFYLPNIPDKTVPISKIGNENKIIKYVGNPRKFSFTPKYHWEIGEKLGILDFTTASKISGPHFTIFKNEGCVLERAIVSFFIDTHKAKGYKEIMLPYLVNQNSMVGTGQLPKFVNDVFKCINDDLYLIPTAEVSITNIYRGEVLEIDTLPQKFVSYSACFRKESGSYGKNTKGLIRNHQFDKVELVKFVVPEKSNEELENLVIDASNVLELLELPYRVVLLSAEDMAFSSAKTYDLETWFAGDGLYKEVSSCSNFKDFQTRRMNTKIKYSKSNKKEFLHTLNGSGLAVGRTFAAILENYQQKDGSIIVPEVLRKYTNFDKIKHR